MAGNAPELFLARAMQGLAKGIIKKNDLTDIAYNNGISKSQLSKLNNKRPFFLIIPVANMDRCVDRLNFLE